MSEAAAFPIGDRTPPGAFAVSLAAGLATLVGSAALVGSAPSLGRAAELVLVFVVLAFLEGLVFVDAAQTWLQGRSIAPRSQALQLVLVILTLGILLTGARTGAAAACGLCAGIFLPSASVIRHHRLSLALLDQGLAGIDEHERTERPVRARAAPKVSPSLRDALAGEHDQALAWAASTLAVTIGCIAFGAPGAATLSVVLVGAVALLRTVRRRLGLRLAVQDFERAVVAPRHAYVVLVPDPHPRATGPLLGVWDEEPVPKDGRLPPATAVYRCSRGHRALASSQGGVVVHEAWLDNGRATTRPRWVAADAGIALPHRRTFLGRRYLADLIDKERPGRPRELTMPVPNPTTEAETGTIATVISEPRTGRWSRLFVRRLAVLVLLAAGLSVLVSWLV